MTTVYKYPFQITPRQQMLLPPGRQIIHVGPDPDGKLCLWAIVDEARGVMNETLWLVGTGQQLPDGVSAQQHIGSCVNGPFVWHVFIEQTV